ncbi:uncharacterized protein IL334_000055 [Kwoniella shivajii]|uniref:Uncharacterized protein n=1 Tax=Kwoniella shivajii TaxID=564305 RepID=A0ABZ1CP66_9TREE|nr:hypothetical protein IL334_000055 [Kwoniella shivajii]
MQFTTPMLISILTVLAWSKGQEENYSNPILVAKPDCVTMDQFEHNFERLCPIWIPPPTASDGWYYDSTSFVRGGSDGKSPDYLATVNCLYTTRGSQKNVAFEIVESLGGSIANEGI